MNSKKSTLLYLRDLFAFITGSIRRSRVRKKAAHASASQKRLTTFLPSYFNLPMRR